MHSFKTQHVWIVALEVNDFSSHSDTLQVNLRDRLRTLVRNASEEAHLDRDSIAAKDEGHGLMLIFRSDVQPLHIAGSFIDRLNENLGESREIYNSAATLRVRIALHHGLATEDEGTWTGYAVQAARDLLKATALETVLSSAPGVHLAVIASEEFYNVVVRPGHRSLSPEAYVSVVLEHGRPHRTRAWIQAPGYLTPPGLPARAQKASGKDSSVLVRLRRRRVRTGAGCLVASALLLTAGMVYLPRADRSALALDDQTDPAATVPLGSKTNQRSSYDLKLRVGREADLDTYGGTVYYSTGLPGDGNDVGFLGDSLWAGVGTSITDVADDSPPKMRTCKKAEDYARGRWSDVEAPGAPASKIRKGQAFCVITSKGDYALLKVKHVTTGRDDAPGSITLQVRVWE